MGCDFRHTQTDLGRHLTNIVPTVRNSKAKSNCWIVDKLIGAITWNSYSPHPKPDAIAHKTPKWDLKRKPQENDHYNLFVHLGRLHGPDTPFSVLKLEAPPNGSYRGTTAVRCKQDKMLRATIETCAVLSSSRQLLSTNKPRSKNCRSRTVPS